MKNNNKFIMTCAFVALVLTAALFLINAILGGFGGSLGWLGALLTGLGQLAMVACVIFPAMDYVKNKTIVWKVILWVALAVYVIAVVIPIIQAML